MHQKGILVCINGWGKCAHLELLNENSVLGHPFVIGELASGSLKQRSEILPLLQFLPMAELSSNDEVLQFIEKRKLFGRGIGWVDAHVLASCALSDCLLWTKDKSLSKQAKELRLAY